MAIASFTIDPDAVELSPDAVVAKVNAATADITRASSVSAAARPIEALEVTDAELATDAVINAKIATGAVDSDELAANAVIEAKLAALAVTNGKIADDAVTGERLRATGVLTATSNVANADTVTIDGKTYTFETSLTDVDGNVLIGASASDSLDNLIAAIILGAGSGTLYAASMTEHSTVLAEEGTGDTIDASAKTGGTGGNSLATTEASTVLSWGGSTLSGGTDSKLAANSARDNIVAVADVDKKFVLTDPITGQNKIVALQRKSDGNLEVSYVTPVV